jgi:electron transfer flavoprotein beta subunit
MGADHVYLLSDRAFGGADTLATTYTLMKGIEKIGGADIILCGEESSDGATGQVPPGLAEWMEVGQITMVSDLEVDLDAGTVRGRREISGGYEILEVPMPLVVSAKTASNEPRFMDFRRSEWAMEPSRVTIWGKKDLDVDEGYIGIKGSPTTVPGLKQAPSRDRRREFLTGNTAELTQQLTTLIQKHSQ